MSSQISDEVRQAVVRRANHVCEYCLIHEDDTFYGCQVDHIISIKHGGSSSPDNLAQACGVCNRAKGSDVGSIIWDTGEFCRFFNPRTDWWSEHFHVNGAEIQPLTPIGQVTARILSFNTIERVVEREALIAVGRYPTPEALEITRR